MGEINNSAEVKKAKAKSAFKDKEDARALNSVLGTKDGRRVVFNMVGMCNVYSVPNGRATEREAGIIDGRRSMGIQLIEWMSAISPEIYPKMMIEFNQGEQA